jgi:hypothetical protein
MHTRVTRFYRCDGGINPTHHHPKGETIVFEYGTYHFGSDSRRKKYENFTSILDELKNKYDRITYEGITTSTHVDKEVVLKWEQNSQKKSA